MNLVIDVGNSFIKFAVFKNSELKATERCELLEFNSVLQNVKRSFPDIDKGILSSVGHLNLNQLRSLEKEMEVLVLSNETALPFNNLYSTPKSLGVDRIGLISAAVLKYAHKNVLVIDAGTCITYDFITAENDYLGGAISPGLRLRYKSLNDYTANLPLLETTIPNSIIGNSTDTSIHSGVVRGVINEIDAAIDEYKSLYSHLTVILTGGDGNFLSKQLKNSIFANSNFLLEGLNFILDHNSN